MDNTWDVFDYLLSLTEIDDDEKEKTTNLCRMALLEINAQLKNGVDMSDIRIISAAACMAYYRLIVRRNEKCESERVSHFQAGDVTVTKEYPDNAKQQLENAEKIMKDALLRLVPLMNDTSFEFRKVD